MKPGSRPMPIHCEHPKCKAKAVMYIPNRDRHGKSLYLCTFHIFKNDDKILNGRPRPYVPFADPERESQEYLRKNSDEVQRVIYDRELSFSEKINLLNL